MDLAAEYLQLNLFDHSWLIRGLPSQLMLSKFFYKKHQHERTINNSMISVGCLITDAEISSSVLFKRITVNEDSACSVGRLRKGWQLDCICFGFLVILYILYHFFRQPHN
ncbi:hypothetical protein [Neisseria iguanae]|uniref:hypothetical protein n=1 Tax=Neisseria iguanae TaxID=90242 RepID=UPI001B803C13|nr:hypothetical protein [Neisseria iguanae]